ncbi:MAG: hypothetical protein ACREJX_16840, partial [Polyangiaceae bacterium]
MRFFALAVAAVGLCAPCAVLAAGCSDNTSPGASGTSDVDGGSDASNQSETSITTGEGGGPGFSNDITL